MSTAGAYRDQIASISAHPCSGRLLKASRPSSFLTAKWTAIRSSLLYPSAVLFYNLSIFSNFLWHSSLWKPQSLQSARLAYRGLACHSAPFLSFTRSLTSEYSRLLDKIVKGWGICRALENLHCALQLFVLQPFLDQPWCFRAWILLRGRPFTPKSPYNMMASYQDINALIYKVIINSFYFLWCKAQWTTMP